MPDFRVEIFQILKAKTALGTIDQRSPVDGYHGCFHNNCTAATHGVVKGNCAVIFTHRETGSGKGLFQGSRMTILPEPPTVQTFVACVDADHETVFVVISINTNGCFVGTLIGFYIFVMLKTVIDGFPPLAAYQVGFNFLARIAGGNIDADG